MNTQPTISRAAQLMLNAINHAVKQNAPLNGQDNIWPNSPTFAELVNAGLVEVKGGFIYPKKFIGCTVEHKHTGTLAICDEDMIDDNNWLFFNNLQIKF